MSNPPKPPSSKALIRAEELPPVTTWQVGALGGTPTRSSGSANAAAHNAAAAAERTKTVEAMRAKVYDQGYRDGLKALDDYKKSQANQFSQRLDGIAQSFTAELRQLENGLAQEVVALALQLARQVIRAELSAHPERLAPVVMEALSALVESKGIATIYVNPADMQMIFEQLGDELTVQGYSVRPDPSLRAGGCRVESTLSSVDASIETRWSRALAAIGRSEDWMP